jgi:hypothetical protein
MEMIKDIPYVEARFDKSGNLENGPIAVPSGTTDLIVISHGWNNNAEDAKSLYTALFQNFSSVAQPGDLTGRSVAVVGVIWPSKQFDELVAPHRRARRPRARRAWVVGKRTRSRTSSSWTSSTE